MMLVVQRAREWPFRPCFAHDPIARGAQQLAPFVGCTGALEAGGCLTWCRTKREPAEAADQSSAEQSTAIEYTSHGSATAFARLNRRLLACCAHAADAFAEADADGAISLAPGAKGQLVPILEEAARFAACQLDRLLAAAADLQQ